MYHMRTETKARRRIVAGHRISWFAYAGPYGERIPCSAQSYYGIGFDAECECGWKSNTGGATKGSVQRDVRSHKFDATGDWRQL